MKRVLSIVLVIAAIACIGISFVGCEGAFTPKLEDDIISTWVSEDGYTTYTFNEDGTVKISKFTENLSLSGTYTVDSETNQLTISYSFMSLSYNDEYTATIEGDVLTLVQGSSISKTTVFNREIEE